MKRDTLALVPSIVTHRDELVASELYREQIKIARSR